MVESLTDKHAYSWEFYSNEVGIWRWRCRDSNNNILRSAHKGFANISDCCRNANLPGMTCVPSQDIPDIHYFDGDTKENLLRTREDEHGRIWQIFKTNDDELGWRCRDADGKKLLTSDKMKYANMDECLENARVPGMGLDCS